LTSHREAARDGKLNNKAARKVAADNKKARMKNTETQNSSKARV
jgi:hypothetical protein